MFVLLTYKSKLKVLEYRTPEQSGFGVNWFFMQVVLCYIVLCCVVLGCVVCRRRSNWERARYKYFIKHALCTTTACRKSLFYWLIFSLSMTHLTQPDEKYLWLGVIVLVCHNDVIMNHRLRVLLPKTRVIQTKQVRIRLVRSIWILLPGTASRLRHLISSFIPNGQVCRPDHRSEILLPRIASFLHHSCIIIAEKTSFLNVYDSSQEYTSLPWMHLDRQVPTLILIYNLPLQIGV